MKKIFPLSCCFLLGMAATAQSFYYEDSSPHNMTNTIDCDDCHGAPDWSGVTAQLPNLLITDCTGCHNNDGTVNEYSKNAAPLMQKHHGECYDCHANHADRPTVGALVSGDFTGVIDNGDGTTTLTGVSVTATDPAAPADWSAKTSADRGLMLYASGVDGAFEVIGSAGSDITVQGTLVSSGGTFDLQYGMMISNTINGNAVTFTGPTADSFGHDETGTGVDPTPTGVCQSCHTTTKYWLADGTSASHNNGLVCTLCHDHAASFGLTGGACDACHGNPPVAATQGGPDGLAGTGSTTPGAHEVHATASGYNFACSTCHTGGMLTEVVLNGPVDIGFDDSVKYDGFLGPLAPQYDGQVGLSYLGDVSATPSGAMTCSNVYCHSMGKTAAMGYDVAQDSVAWDTPGPLACDSCHTSPPKFDEHAYHAAWGVSDCSVCHYSTTTDGTTIADKSLHVNGQYDVVPSGTFINYQGVPISFTFDYAYAPGGGTCSSNSCHDQAHISPTSVWDNRDLFLDASLNQSVTLNENSDPICGSMDYTATVVPSQDMVAPFNCDYDFDGDGVFDTTADCSTAATYDYTEGGTVVINWDTIRDLTWTAHDQNGISLPDNPRTEQVIVCPSPNILPTVQGNVAMTYAGNFGVRLTDTSFDPDFDQYGRSGPGRISIDWGDGSAVEEFDINLTATSVSHIYLHNYPRGGRFYVRYSIMDNALSTQWVDAPVKSVYVLF